MAGARVSLRCGYAGSIMTTADRDDSEPPPAHRRRPRYRGSHPRRFEEKYKERAPERYPELVEHVRERGRTPAVSRRGQPR